MINRISIFSVSGLPIAADPGQTSLLAFTALSSVNRKDRFGKNVLEGGFLGLDNIGVFDRSAPLPTGGNLEQADGTAWMALFSQNMVELATEIAVHDPTYEDMVLKITEHFYYIWLGDLSRKYRRVVDLATVPSEEWIRSPPVASTSSGLWASGSAAPGSRSPCATRGSPIKSTFRMRRLPHSVASVSNPVRVATL